MGDSILVLISMYVWKSEWIGIFFGAGWVTQITQWGYVFGADWVTQITQWGYFIQSGLSYSNHSMRVFYSEQVELLRSLNEGIFSERVDYSDPSVRLFFSERVELLRSLNEGIFFGAGWGTQITRWGYLNLQNVKRYSFHKIWNIMVPNSGF